MHDAARSVRTPYTSVIIDFDLPDGCSESADLMRETPSAVTVVAVHSQRVVRRLDEDLLIVDPPLLDVGASVGGEIGDSVAGNFAR